MTTTKRRSRDAMVARNALIDTMSSGEVYQSTSEYITECIMQLRDKFNLTSAQWSYLDGYADAIKNGWYRTKLVYAVEYKGRLYKMEWNTLPEEVKVAIRNESVDGKLPTGHYWLNSDGSIGRPYFVSKA